MRSGILFLSGCLVTASGQQAGPRPTSAAAGYTKVEDLPVPLQNLVNQRDRVAKKLAELEQGGAYNDVHFLRINELSLFMGILRGGAPGDCEACKQNPAYRDVRDAFPDIERRLSGLEHQAGCTFGFAMSDGTILAPSLDWSVQDFEDLAAKAKDGQARCWSDKDPGQYF